MKGERFAASHGVVVRFACALRGISMDFNGFQTKNHGVFSSQGTWERRHEPARLALTSSVTLKCYDFSEITEVVQELIPLRSQHRGASPATPPPTRPIELHEPHGSSRGSPGGPSPASARRHLAKRPPRPSGAAEKLLEKRFWG